MSDATSELRFSTINEIIDELNRRHEAVLVVLQTHDPKESVVNFFFHGGSTTCVGLAEIARARLIASLTSSMSETLLLPDEQTGEWEPDSGTNPDDQTDEI